MLYIYHIMVKSITKKRLSSLRNHTYKRIKHTKQRGGFDESDESDESHLFKAIEENRYEENFEEVKSLLEAGADANELWKNDERPIHLASWIGDIEVVKQLLEHGADINPVDINGDTPLHYAVMASNYWPVPFDVIPYLIEKGADVTIKNKNGKTAADLSNRRNGPSKLIIENLRKKEENVIRKKERKLSAETLSKIPKMNTKDIKHSVGKFLGGKRVSRKYRKH